jgi:hypothetical protein
MIWSKPTYVPLAWDKEGHTHLLAAHGDGGECLLRLLAESLDGPVSVRYAIDSLGANDCYLRLAQAAGADYQVFNTIALLLTGMRTDLAAGRMGLRLYLAGSEHFLWSATSIAAGFGLGADEIRREHYGSAARSVYCVHCKTITPDVRTNVVSCPGCARALMVRDHYSARLAAYMGFQVDAEDPGTIPQVESVYA